jgi:DNA polymerase-3 subunit gamma/tau
MAQFARMWRPKRFEDVVGQELVVSLLRNSLFRNSLFPVYLFAGQRGCGKTTLARIFAAAMNCEQRALFASQPHGTCIPCYSCSSCKAMHEGSHTDFHEIDAASHTGVDHVRTILEATSLAPQLGVKRIYLIDEVHMLSRAACNALLKTLEEPLDTVVFLLATTDPHKIPDTVRSRCFQLFLSPLSQGQVAGQLERICTQENIAYEKEAVELIAHSSEGSLRDAINTFERIFIAYSRIHKVEVATLVGMLQMSDMFDLFEAIAQRDISKALELGRRPTLVRVGVPYIWKMMYEVFRLMVSCHYNALPHDMVLYEQRLRMLLQQIPLQRVMDSWQISYAMELSMLKSSYAIAAWELLLVRLCQDELADGLLSTGKQVINKKVAAQSAFAEKSVARQEGEKREDKVAPIRTQAAQNYSGDQLWDQVLAHMQQSETNTSVRQQHAATSVRLPQKVPSLSSAAQSTYHNHQPSAPVQQKKALLQPPDDIAQKVLALFPGTLTIDERKESL